MFLKNRVKKFSGKVLLVSARQPEKKELFISLNQQFGKNRTKRKMGKHFIFKTIIDILCFCIVLCEEELIQHSYKHAASPTFLKSYYW